MAAPCIGACDLAPSCELWCGPQGVRGPLSRDYPTADGCDSLWEPSQDGRWDDSDADPLEQQRTHSHRGHLVARLFRALGDDSWPRRLDESKFGHFARLCGFAAEGGFEDSFEGAWSQEYFALCLHEGWTMSQGLSLRDFEAFVSNQRCKGYCTELELVELLAALEVPLPRSVGRAVRQQLLEELFHELAVKVVLATEDGGEKGCGLRLREKELSWYSNLCGFCGGSASWYKEYQALCMRRGWTPKIGLCLTGFEDFVNDQNGPGYSTDEELLAMLVMTRTMKQRRQQPFQHAEGETCGAPRATQVVTLPSRHRPVVDSYRE